MLAQILTRAATRFDDETALVSDTGTLSDSDFEARSDRVPALAARGIASSDHISIHSIYAPGLSASGVLRRVPWSIRSS
jgi:non-ribosomal peptide synthetase component E (peptide arylation enzyme)